MRRQLLLAFVLLCLTALPAVGAPTRLDALTSEDVVDWIIEAGNAQARVEGFDAALGAQIIFVGEYYPDQRPNAPLRRQYLALKEFPSIAEAGAFEATLRTRHDQGRYFHPSRFTSLGRWVLLELPNRPGSSAYTTSVVSQLRNWAEALDPDTTERDPVRWADEVPESQSNLAPAAYRGLFPLRLSWREATAHMRSLGGVPLTPETTRNLWRVGPDVVRLLGSPHHSEQVSVIAVAPTGLALDTLRTRHGRPSRDEWAVSRVLGQVWITEWRQQGVVAIAAPQAPHTVWSLTYHHPKFPDFVYYLDRNRSHQALALTFSAATHPSQAEAAIEAPVPGVPPGELPRIRPAPIP